MCVRVCRTRKRRNTCLEYTTLSAYVCKRMSRPPLSRAALRWLPVTASQPLTTMQYWYWQASKQAASGSHNLALPDAVLPPSFPR